MRRRRKRLSGDSWSRLRLRVYVEQGGLCAGCGKPMRREAFDLAHLSALGMGRSRHDAESESNARENVAAMCRRCHVHLDGLLPVARQAMADRLRVLSMPADGHGARRTGRC